MAQTVTLQVLKLSPTFHIFSVQKIQAMNYYYCYFKKEHLAITSEITNAIPSVLSLQTCVWQTA